MAKKTRPSTSASASVSAEPEEETQNATTNAAEENGAEESGDHVTIDGSSYAPGATASIGGKDYTVVGTALLRASPTSGVSDGDYAVVYELIGDRKAYRAVVNGDLYPIRQYGTPDAVVSKQRESKGEGSRTKRSTPARAETAHASDHLDLTRQASDLLDDYVSLKRGGDQGEIISELIVRHLGPEVERLRKAQEAIQKLPADLLALLAGASDEKRAQILDLLK